MQGFKGQCLQCHQGRVKEVTQCEHMCGCKKASHCNREVLATITTSGG